MFQQKKRKFYLSIAVFTLLLLSAFPVVAKEVRSRISVNPEEAKQLLIEGNKRFISGKVKAPDIRGVQRKDLFKNGQTPFAAIVSCSDSRVVPEIVFNQGLGDLFVVQVAGNVLDSIGMGSIEFGTSVLGARVIMVLGHEDCGAVHATVDQADVSDNIASIAHRIQPAVNKVVARHKGPIATSSDIYESVTDENVRQVVAQLKSNEIIKKLMAEGKVDVVGAKYILATGEVQLIK